MSVLSALSDRWDNSNALYCGIVCRIESNGETKICLQCLNVRRSTLPNATYVVSVLFYCIFENCANIRVLKMDAVRIFVKFLA